MKLQLLSLAAASASAMLSATSVASQASDSLVGTTGKLKGAAFPKQVSHELNIRSTKSKSSEKKKDNDKSKKSNKDEDKSKKSAKDSKTTKSTKTTEKSWRSKRDWSDDECIDNIPRRVYRNSGYRFRVPYRDTVCVDRDDEKYQYGQFNNVREFSDCAEMCVEETNGDLLDNLVGFNWSCNNKKCRCLYDKGALGDQRSSHLEVFDNVNEENKGRGSVDGVRNKDGWYCAKLAQTEEGEVQASRRGLRA